jgi:hypothetical protein
LHNNIAVELIKTFSDEDVKNFGEYIKCSLFNKRKELVKLFNVIAKCRPDYTNTVLKREKLFKKLYPKSKYDEQTLRTRMTELTTLIRGYFSLFHNQKNPYQQKMSLAKELMSRDKYKMSAKILNDIIEVLENEKYNNSDYFVNKYFALSELCNIFSMEGNYKELLNKEINRNESLIYFFLSAFLNSSRDIITDNIQNKVKKDSPISNQYFKCFSPENFLSFLKETNNEHYALIAIYYYSYLTRKENDVEEHYYNLKDIVFKEYNKFPKKDLFNFWDYLSSAVFPVLINKDKKFYNERHIINKFFIELNVFLTINDKYIHTQTFNNIANSAMVINELEWAEQFILKHKDFLLPEFKENTFNYCMACLCTKKKEFEKSLDYLSKIKMSELAYNLDTRFCYIVNYYELNLFDQFFSSIDACKHFISENNNIPAYAIEMVKNSLKFLTKMGNTKSGNKKLDFAELKKAETVSSFFVRKWILEKMKELV